MSIENLFDHTCNIYHLIENKMSPGYSLPTSPVFKYAEKPNISCVNCHFCRRSNNITITQKEPQNVMTGKIKLILPIETKIHRGDKIVDCATNLEYTADQPLNIRNHHLAVYVQRVAEQETL